MHLLDQKRAERRPDNRRKTPHRRARPLDAGPLGRAVDVADDSHRDRLDRPRADTLQRAKRDQERHRSGKAAQGRAGQENDRADKEHALPAVEVSKAAIDRDRHRHRQQRHGKDPAEQLKSAKIADDRRQGGGDDRALDRRHEDRDQRRRSDQLAAGDQDGRPDLLDNRLVHRPRPYAQIAGRILGRSAGSNNPSQSAHGLRVAQS